jgi:3-deoxy-D-manno-octulosonate 8-phosphate phosphatase (KDO 8-P phosphatase)
MPRATAEVRGGPRAAGAARRRASRVTMVVLDVDGVLTDGRLYFGARGEVLKAFDVRDGHGIKLLRSAGLGVALLTARSSRIVAARARELGIADVLQGQQDKLAGLRRLLRRAGVEAERCAYMGDDWPDLPVLAEVGFAAAVADAAPEVRRAAHWVAPAAGGRGAVRALAEYVLRAQSRFERLLQAGRAAQAATGR